jgi:hypothetical protein
MVRSRRDTMMRSSNILYDIRYDISYNIGYDIVSDIVYDIVSDIVSDICLLQVNKLVRLLKHKIRTENAYFKAKRLEFFFCAPKETSQFFIGLYGDSDHILLATMHEIQKVLLGPDIIKGFTKKKAPVYIISQIRLRIVWKRLRDRLATVDSSTSTVEITNDYAAHFYDMYINKHDGEHMTGDRMTILLLNLPFLLRDPVEPKVRRLYLTRCLT